MLLHKLTHYLCSSIYVFCVYHFKRQEESLRGTASIEVLIIIFQNIWNWVATIAVWPKEIKWRFISFLKFCFLFQSSASLDIGAILKWTDLNLGCHSDFKTQTIGIYIHKFSPFYLHIWLLGGRRFYFGRCAHMLSLKRLWKSSMAKSTVIYSVYGLLQKGQLSNGNWPFCEHKETADHCN